MSGELDRRTVLDVLGFRDADTRRLIFRTLAGLGLAVVVAGVLWLVIERSDAIDEARKAAPNTDSRAAGPAAIPEAARPRAGVGPNPTPARRAAGSATARRSQGGEDSVPGRDPDEPVRLPAEFPKGTVRSVVLIAPGSFSVLSRRVAPVLSLAADGSIRVVRGVPPKLFPEQEQVWDVGVLLPEAKLAQLAPRARVALLQVLAAWQQPEGGEPVQIRREALRTLGVRYSSVELDALLRWQRCGG